MRKSSQPPAARQTFKTPQHRSLIAKLKKQNVPDDKAIKIVDAALSASETKKVLAIDDQRRIKEQSLVRSQGGPGLMLQEQGKPDAGELLLDNRHLTLLTPN